MKIMNLKPEESKIFDIAVDSLKQESAISFYRVFKLMVNCKTNNYSFTYYAYESLAKLGYNSDLFDLRTFKLFRKSLAKFLLDGKIQNTLA